MLISVSSTNCYVKYRVNFGNQATTYLFDNFNAGDLDAVGIESGTTVERTSIAIYPNLAYQTLFISDVQAGQLEIYGISGKLLKTRMVESASHPVNITDLTKGIYPNGC